MTGTFMFLFNSTSYFALAGSPQEELPDTSDPGSMGGWIGLLGLVLLVFSKKKE
jgi:LPXTG-motif cell wall-anchored protein